MGNNAGPVGGNPAVRLRTTATTTSDPLSHVRVVSSADFVDIPSMTEPPTERDWVITDGSGSRRGHTASRAQAVRLMSRLATRGDSVLPLTVIDWRGRPSGDRLA
jgi:hypothetical protein